MDYSSEQTVERFVLTAPLPEWRAADIKITAEGNRLHIALAGKQANRQNPIEDMIEIPPGYELARAQAIYLKGQLRIVIPRQQKPRNN
jgi:HSP20 family molecular chaperone IbpA